MHLVRFLCIFCIGRSTSFGSHRQTNWHRFILNNHENSWLKDIRSWWCPWELYIIKWQWPLPSFVSGTCMEKLWCVITFKPLTDVNRHTSLPFLLCTVPSTGSLLVLTILTSRLSCHTAATRFPDWRLMLEPCSKWTGCFRTILLCPIEWLHRHRSVVDPSTTWWTRISYWSRDATLVLALLGQLHHNIVV